MKTITNRKHLILCFLLIQTVCFSQTEKNIHKNLSGIKSNRFFYGPDGKETFNIANDKIAIKFKEKTNKEDIRLFLSKTADLKENSYNDSNKVNGYDLIELKLKLNDEMAINKIKANLKNNEIIDHIEPILIYKDGTSQIGTEQFFIKIKKSSDYAQLKSDSKILDFVIDSKHQYNDLIYFAHIEKSNYRSAIEIANELFLTGKYDAVEPIFIKLMNKFTNDPDLSYQWAINNIGSTSQYNGTPGADMKVFEAWSISTGNAAIKVAVIDEGVDLNHPDLIDNLLPGYDATGLGSNGSFTGNDPHGTACAGIIAAVGNNNIGLAGVAYGVKIVPIRIAYGGPSGWITNDVWLSNGIDWAWNQGQADVLSNSWGGGSSSTLINDAINRAVTLGRGNKGSPVLFSAGNYNEPVAYPASNNNTIAVIASSMCDQRKSYTSCDGEPWGSNYGTHADVAAPGVKIYTTDISGSNGYNSTNYMPTFNGTSSACPNAAGVMALILSVNSDLTQTQARAILESTCDKVGSYSYNGNVSGQPNGTWSFDLGYGRINAYAAVQMAGGYPCTSAPTSTTTLVSQSSTCVPVNVTFSLKNAYPLTGTTFQWETSNDGTNFVPVSGANANYLIFNVTSDTYARCVISCNGIVNSSIGYINYIDATISDFPHSEKFATNTLPCGWMIENTNGDNFSWGVRNSTSRTPAYSLGYIKNPNQAANDWVFSPPLAMEAGKKYAARFWYRASSATLPESFEVKWGSSQNSNSMTSVPVYTNTNVVNTTYQVVNSDTIIPAVSGSYHIGFHVLSNANMANLHLDDITFDTIGPCSTPLQGGTITGPSIVSVGIGTPANFGVSGYSGYDLQWEQSSNGGSTWTDLTGKVVPNIAIAFLTLGNYQLRVKVSSLNCPSVYSDTFNITVVPRIGDLFTNPIIASGYNEYIMNTGPNSGFYNDYTGPFAQPSNDVFFRYTTGPCTDSLSISTCGSSFDTYVHILDQNGAHIFSIDDGPICNQTPLFKINVEPNSTYYIVAEGWNTQQGLMELQTSEILHISNYPTTITPSGLTNLCGNSIYLSTNSGNSYIWSTGETTQSIVASSAGTYSVTVTFAGGCTGSDNTLITSGLILTWYQDSDGDGYGNNNASVALCEPPFGYISDNTDCNDGNSNVFPGSPEVCENGIDDDCDSNIDEGCCNVALSGTVINASCSNISNGSINITVSNFIAPLAYVWNNGALTEDLTNIGVGNYSVTVTDGYACTATSSFTVNHNNQVPGTPTAINGPSGACRGQTGVVFSVDPISGASAYVWTLPNGASGSSSTNTIVLSFSNNYNTGNICVRSLNACGQSSQFCRTIIRYNNAPATPGTISGLSQGVCPNTSYTYTITPVTNATSYTWTPPANATITSGQGTTSVVVSFNSSFGTSGTLSVKSSNCIGNSSNRNLTIQRIPAQPASITGPVSVCTNQTNTIYSVTNVPFYTYNWLVPSGCTIVSGQGTNSIVVNWGSNSGNISVRSQVSCASSAYRTLSVTVTSCGTTPDNTSLISNNYFNLMPNPVLDIVKFYFETEIQVDCNLEINDIQGRILHRSSMISQKGENKVEIDLSQFLPGIYTFKYKDSNGTVFVRPLFKF